MNLAATFACLTLLAILGGCGREPTAQEKAAADEHAVAQVRTIADGKPPPEPLKLEAIRFDDIQANRLFDPGCAFAPGGSMGAVLLAQDKAGYVKLDGRMVRLASDPGSERLPAAGWSRYTGKAFAVRLDRTGGHRPESGGGRGARWPARLTIADAYGQAVYAADGAVQCAA